MIDALSLYHEQPIEGLDLGQIRSAVGPGLYVVAGENNVGKTRVLRAIAEARLLARIEGAALQKTVEDSLAPRSGYRPPAAPDVEVSWPREGLKVFERGLVDVPNDLQLTRASRAQLVERFSGAHPDVEYAIRMVAWQEARSRPAKFIPTDRYFDARSTVHGSYSPDPAQPSQWTGVLANLEQNLGQRRTFQAISDALHEITHGLRLTCSREDRGLVVFVEGVGEPRPLDSCGDGLRDVVGILLFAEIYPRQDLMLDEPGLRLHPGAQRRLLAYLEKQAKNRAIWIASHDGVFIGGAAVERRFFVTREPSESKSSVTELLGRRDCAQAMSRLGWEPKDAFLADNVLLVEGVSDKTAFSEVVNWLEVEDPSWGGTLVSHLGGNAAVWGSDRSILKERLSLVRRIVPSGTCSVLLDRDARTESEIEALAKSLAALDIPIHFLKRGELEDYWLGPATISAILAGLASDARDAGQPISNPTQDAIDAAIAETDVVGKASVRLEAIASRLSIRFGKDRAAMHAVAALAESAPAAALELREAVQAALGRVPSA